MLVAQRLADSSVVRSALEAAKQLTKTQPLALRYWSTSTNTEEAWQAVQQVKKTLEDALESAGFVQVSADQLFLETDPAARQPRAHYQQIYRTFARDELEGALQQYHRLQDKIGPDEMTRMQDTVGLAMTVADSMLTRDQLDQAIRKTEQKFKQQASAERLRQQMAPDAPI